LRRLEFLEIALESVETVFHVTKLGEVEPRTHDAQKDKNIERAVRPVCVLTVEGLLLVAP
jgi:hypothetical protein